MAGEEQKDDEAALLMMMCGGGLPILMALLARMFDGVRVWLIERHILLEPADSLWIIPGVEAGLDLLRIVAVLAFVGLVVVAPAMVVRSRRAQA